MKSMERFLLEPILAGFSVGAFCLTTCLPFVAPCIVAENRTFLKNLVLILQFLFGRLIGYVAFGAFFGYLGEKLDNTWLQLIANGSLLVLSLLLILFVSGLFRTKMTQACTAGRRSFQHPVAMGFLMGVNLCPPFLMSLAYVFSLHSAGLGVLYFLLFFLSSSVYFLPLLAAGFLGRMKEFQLAARISGLLVGVIFLIHGCRTLADLLSRLPKA